LKYVLCNSSDCCGKIFPSLAWAGYLKDWDGPVPGERPSAYIIILGDKTVAESFNVDHGIAAQSIMLGASESGLGGCMIASIRRELLRKEISIPENFEILLVLALGKPVENVILEEVKDGDIKYWRDSDQNHHVPKRKLEDVIIKI
jgi:nitroreductase